MVKNPSPNYQDMMILQLCQHLEIIQILVIYQHKKADLQVLVQIQQEEFFQVVADPIVTLTNIIEFITIASTGNATDFGDQLC